MRKKRLVLFASASVVLTLTVSLATILALDTYLHAKFDQMATLNRWGYRGAVVGRKQSNEWRLAVLGGSTAWGYGVRWQEAIPAQLQDLLNSTDTTGQRTVTVVNLAYNNEGAHGFKFALADYDYLDYDAALFYSGYNDIGPNTQVWRHQSPIFRLTGYMPVFPLVFTEKAMSLRYGGALNDAYLGKKTTFRPGIVERGTASALEAAVAVSRSLERQLARGFDDPPVDDGSTAEGAACGATWAHYCGEMYEAIKLVLDKGKSVLIGTQPLLRPIHEEQQIRLHDFLKDRFSGHPRLRYANLLHEVDLKDATSSFDGMHLWPAGNRRIAVALEPYVRRMLQ